MKIIFTLLAGVMLTGFSIAQITNNTNTVGLLYTEPEKVSDGLILFAPNYSKSAYLIDNCGYVAHQWNFETASSYSSAYLLPNGSVVRIVARDEPGNADGCIEIRNWQDELTWRYCSNEEIGFNFHSDLQHLPNGNLLVLSIEILSAADAIKAGVDPDKIGNSYYTEKIVELKPDSANDASLVWEWRMADHLVQDFDSAKLNFGNIKENFRKINANLDNYFHFNSIEYNADLEQIALSNYSNNEIYIIEHGTNTQETAGSIGGKYGFGGDLLFRWGNPGNYGVEGEQQLFEQHDPQWISNDNSRFGGKLSLFNNRYGELEGIANTSGVFVLDIDPEQDGIYALSENGTFLPETADYVWTGNAQKYNIYSPRMSGVNVLPNGHLLICEANQGRFTEVDNNDNIIWTYVSPEGRMGSVIEQEGYPRSEVYKIKKYKYKYIPQLNKALCGTNIIENENELTALCKAAYQPKVDFSFTINNDTVVFSTQTNNTDGLLWNFGDGNTSEEINPTNKYKEIGTYKVCLEANNCYGADTLCKEIKIDQITAINEVATLGAVQIYPVPAIAQIHITTTNNFAFTNYLIYNLAGKLIKDGNYVDHKIAVDFLADGVYLLQLTNHLNNESIIFKFIKSQ